jgi:hypothetical protein
MDFFWTLDFLQGKTSYAGTSYPGSTVLCNYVDSTYHVYSHFQLWYFQFVYVTRLAEGRKITV